MNQPEDNPGNPANRRLLIAVGSAYSAPDELPAAVQELIDGADEILVIAPRLPTRLEWLASATDRAREQADERLHAVLDQLDEVGVQASGRIGADDPLLAFEDAIREFAPDALVIALRAREEAGWQERGLVDSLRERFGLPITVFEVRDGQAQG